MTEQGTKRKLTAILSADVKEYSRLMSQDERGTIHTLTAYREAMSKLIQEYKGRVVDSPGDNLLAEFGSVVDAVNCAVEIQRELAERNAELPPARQMEFRIGINLGDVVEEEGRIYGDGVNIAARIEGLAEAGGICISGTAYDQVVNKMGLEYEFLGEQQVKNIERPIRVYRVLSFPGAAAHRVIKAKSITERKWLKGALSATTVLVLGVVIVAIWNFYFRTPFEPASEEKMAFSLPDKPSIAVLPFTNMSDDPKQEYFSDGITEEIITSLSKTPKLFIIARSSSFRYKSKEIDVRTVGRELGVRYVLEGSVRKDGDRVRITAQLIDAKTNKHVWAERYDRDLTNIFAIQDEVTLKVITALQVNLSEGEEIRIYAKGTENLEAYLRFLKGRRHLDQVNREGNANAKKFLKEAITLDSEYPAAYAFLAMTHLNDIVLMVTKSPKKSLTKAIELAKKAIELDESLADAHALLGYLYTMRRQHEKGVAQAEQAIALNPNSASAYHWYGLTLNYAGHHKEAIKSHKKAIRLNPFPPIRFYFCLAIAYRDAKRYEEAIAASKKALEQAPNCLFAHTCLASCYALMERWEDAHAEIEKALRVDPKLSLARIGKMIMYKYEADRKFLIESLRKAGLK